MTDPVNIFERAARLKLRIQSPRGELAPEQLWDLPLTSKSGFDLDTVARAVHADLKACTEESFVATKKNPAAETHALRLELVKFVIEDKIAEDAARLDAADKAAKKAKIIDALAKKQDQALDAKSIEELQKDLAALS